MILYFSGTGNSRYVAKRIAAITGDKLVDINAKIKNGDYREIEGEDLVFVTPTYAWRIPQVVEDWIRETEFAGAKRAWFVMTCGDENGNAEKYIKRLCADKKWKYMRTAEVVMPENYIAMFDVPKPETQQKIIANAEPVIDEYASRLKNGQRLPAKRITLVDNLKSGIVNWVFNKFAITARPFRTTDACIGCGKCEMVCPMNNIEIEDRRPVWHKDCTHCMACISYCPVEAIEYGKKSEGKPRYHFPEE